LRVALTHDERRRREPPRSLNFRRAPISRPVIFRAAECFASGVPTSVPPETAVDQLRQFAS
jgi:hypothetical protein